MTRFLFLLSFFIPHALFAAGAGYISEGRVTYIYKDGVEVDNTKVSLELNRGPANLAKKRALFFTEDDLARCYFWLTEDGKKPKKDLHCVRKPEIK